MLPDKTRVTLVLEPEIYLLAEMQLHTAGVLSLADWVKRHRPDCVPETGFTRITDLLPHGPCDQVPSGAPPQSTDRLLSDNELLAEIAGRKCYDSFAEKAGKKTNREYLEHIFSMDPLHSSILYHAKMTFGFAGVSRKLSHQFIRNYVGSDRDEEGSPSQESTRFTRHYGHYIVPPYITDSPPEMELFELDCQQNYDRYLAFIARMEMRYTAIHDGPPKGPARKEIYEAAAGLLNMSAETSFVWTTNPMALQKFLKERCHAAADAEIYRFARALAPICFLNWPNLFIGGAMDRVREELLKP